MLTKLLIVADIVMLIFFALAWPLLPKEIPLYYSASWGEDQIADLWEISIIPVMLHAVFFINQYVIRKYLYENKLLVDILKFTTIFFIVGLTAVFLKILILVT